MRKFIVVVIFVATLSGCGDWEKVTPRMEDAEVVTPPKKYDYDREEMSIPLGDPPSTAHRILEVDRRYITVDDNSPENICLASVGLTEPGWRYVLQQEVGDKYIVLYVRFAWVEPEGWSQEWPQPTTPRVGPPGPQGITMEEAEQREVVRHIIPLSPEGGDGVYDPWANYNSPSPPSN